MAATRTLIAFRLALAERILRFTILISINSKVCTQAGRLLSLCLLQRYPGRIRYSHNSAKASNYRCRVNERAFTQRVNYDGQRCIQSWLEAYY